ncbi:MAG: ATP-binding protein [Kiritimatiellae bacterium]|nr:ATP-binding protein [Kiritimatiellia bacterium]
MKEYKTRLADSILQKKLASSGAVLIEGAKWCGKTTTASQIAKSILFMQDPAQKKQNLEMADMDPSFLLNGQTPRLIDEWQLAPKLWDAIRYEVDKRDEFGQFVLTGSAVPADLSEISHSGTGRISRMLMRPMSLYESGESNGSVSLGDLFSDNEKVAGTNSLDLEQIAFLICRGGWPKSIGTNTDVALQLAINYFDAVVNDDISRVDNVKRDSEKAKRILRSYARSIASQAKITSITQDVYANEEIEDLTNKNATISSYISALKKIFVIEDSLAWNPNLRSKTAIRASDTRYFTDPSIGAAALGLGPRDLINDIQTMGLMFENLCIRDLRIYADALDGQVYHYRDRNNLECDAVVHLRNGSYGLIEIKLGGDRLIEEGAKTLNKLEANIDTTKMKAPSFKMVLTGVGNYAYSRKDGVLIVPIGSLKN